MNYGDFKLHSIFSLVTFSLKKEKIISLFSATINLIVLTQRDIFLRFGAQFRECFCFFLDSDDKFALTIDRIPIQSLANYLSLAYCLILLKVTKFSKV